MPRRRGVYLLTHPRSASNLFQTMMAKQRSYGADVQGSGYHFFDAAFKPMMAMDRGSLNGPNWPKAERDALYEPYQAAFEKLNGELAKAEENVSIPIIPSSNGREARRSEVMIYRPGLDDWLYISMACFLAWRAHGSFGTCGMAR